MRVFDELGNPWKVRGGDPAARLVNKLQRSRYRLVVLPLATLATGTSTEPAVIPDDPIRAVRLEECLAALRA